MLMELEEGNRVAEPGIWSGGGRVDRSVSRGWFECSIKGRTIGKMKYLCGAGSQPAVASPGGILALVLGLLCLPLHAADPDWPSVEKHALDLLQKYIRIASVNPPAKTVEAAALIKAELEAAGFTPKLYTSGAQGQTNIVVRLPGRDRSKKPLLLAQPFRRGAGGCEGLGGDRSVRRCH